MNKRMKLMATAVVALLSMNACGDDYDSSSAGEETSSGTPVEFEMSVNTLTRTATDDSGYSTAFSSGDVVGVFVYDEDDASVFSNIPYEYDGSSWTAQSTEITVPEDAAYKYYAYYPYDESNTSPTSLSFTVNTDQTEGYDGENDPLMARNEDVVAGATTVALRFTHVFALVQVTLDGEDAAEDASVTLRNVLPTTTANLVEASVGDASGDAVTVAMKPLDTNGDSAPFNFRAVVPAQTITAGTELLSTTSGGTTYVYTYSADVPYENGKYRQISVTLGEETQDITIGIDSDTAIEDWEASDPVDGEGTVTEVVVSIINSFGETLTSVTASPAGLTEDTWFYLTQNATVGAYGESGIEDDVDTDWGKAAWLSYTSIYDGTANSWYRITLGYYHCSADAPVSGGIYRVTLKIKGELTDAGTVSKLVFTCRNADNDASFAAGTNPSSFTATMATVTPDEAATWQDYTFYVDFSKKATNVGSNITFSDTEASDYAAFDLRIYTNDAGTETVTSNTAKIYISDVVMEAYTE